jgi:chromosome segregation ATPase
MSNSITTMDEQIAEIANRMADEGQKVSPLAIWSEVHTGSVVAVAAALRKWRETRAPQVPQVGERPALPEAVTDSMRDALDRLWTSAQDEAEQAVAQRLASMRQRVEDASIERDDALAELQITVEELDALQSRLDQMTNAYEANVDALAGMEEDIAQAVQRTDAAEEHAQELAERVSTLEAELEHAVSELIAERETRSRQDADVTEVEAGASAGNEPVSVAAESESKCAEQETAHSEAITRLENELEATRVALQAEQEAHAARREELAEAREKVTKWSEYANGLTQDLAQANEKIIVTHARSAGEASLSRKLAAELNAVQPEHELLRKEVQEQVIVEALTAHLEPLGYKYDAETGVVPKMSTESTLA